jgi:hypothetical protein
MKVGEEKVRLLDVKAEKYHQKCPGNVGKCSEFRNNLDVYWNINIPNIFEFSGCFMTFPGWGIHDY